jgi:OOP family OmpA-OmpF porin
MTRLWTLLFTLISPTLGAAQDLQLPGNAVATYQEAGSPDTLAIATGPWANGSFDNITAEGTVSQSAWRIAVGGLTTMQVLQPLRDQLIAAGYSQLFNCDDDACGGFDFRFALDVLPPPDMQVNLGDFRYWSGTKDGDNGPDHIALLISQIAQAAYVQIDHVSTGGDTTGNISTSGRAVAPAATAQTDAAPTDMAASLRSIGRAVLDDLQFVPGSAELGDATYTSLATLADILRADQSLSVALVGHTDSAGSLEGNINLSKRRARAVRQRLIAAYDIPSDQLAAEGMGYLSPVANNQTEAGREANRRVEVIVTSTE